MHPHLSPLFFYRGSPCHGSCPARRRCSISARTSSRCCSAMLARSRGSLFERYNRCRYSNRNEDLAASRYRFTLDDGSTVEVRGDESIEYDGEVHIAANLHEALREGYYGKF